MMGRRKPRTWSELPKTDHRMVAIGRPYMRRIFGHPTLRYAAPTHTPTVNPTPKLLASPTYDKDLAQIQTPGLSDSEMSQRTS